MESITAVLGCHEFGVRKVLGSMVGSQISTGMEDIAGSSAARSTLIEGLKIDLSHFEAGNAKPQGDYLWQVVDIAIRGIPTILEIRFECLLMTFGRTRLECSI
jgi:hypothetical protein